MVGLLRRYSMVKRYGKIVDVLVKYGFGYFVDQMGLQSWSRFKSRFGKAGKAENFVGSSPERARKALEELGPTYVKFGQLLSMRQDLVPEEYAKELSKLQNRVSPFPFEDVEARIRSEFGVPISELFAEFDREPIAAASIGQVHSAKLYTGEKVAVKIQRPAIRKIVDADLDIMYSLAGFAAEHIEEIKLYDPVGVVDEISRSIHAELDYTQEARNIERFMENMRGNKHIVIPRVYWDYSSEKVLTLEFIDGVKCDDFEKVKEMGVDVKKVAVYGVEAFMKQVFEDGFFHADMHSGNVFVLQDGRIALLDMGMSGHISTEMRGYLLDALIAITRGDLQRYIEVLKDLGMIDEEVRIESLKNDYEYLLNKYYGRSLKQIDTAEMLGEMVKTLRKYHVHIPPNIALLFKGTMTISGFAMQLSPDLNIATIAEPYARKVMFERMKPRNMAQGIYNDLWYAKRFLKKAPLQLSHVLSIAERGYLNLRFEHQGLDRIVAEINAASNRLAFSLIISAIIVGSSLVIQTGMEPFLWGVPLIGAVGFLTAGFLGMALVVYIMRTGNI
ncbi:AarF/ABC1/UbiB kinase family protein [Methanohalophilus sp.]|uniref:ABC1 kinase family protein n=1 Tax=Methanohalophilus sp. TaxID=1966352 RepID=UPI00260FD6AA|nr:AarF/ABC1/UbiB kinase family protein [Methanohalophilus sp.]MDK2893017.1 ubiquinone biosynthesis protein [Methanohalophilus sp.]